MPELWLHLFIYILFRKNNCYGFSVNLFEILQMEFERKTDGGGRRFLKQNLLVFSSLCKVLH